MQDAGRAVRNRIDAYKKNPGSANNNTMTWDKKARLAAWACFVLMWVALAGFIIAIAGEKPSEDAVLLIVVFLALLAAFVILLMVSCLGPLLVSWRESRIVRAEGTVVPAVITGVSDTGIYINSQPVLELAITVHPPHEPAFNAVLRKTIPFSSIPQVQPGAEIDVYYIPGTTRVAMPE
jgi:hypothetical protein